MHELNGLKLFLYRLKKRNKLQPSNDDNMYFSFPRSRFYKETRTFFENLFKTQNCNRIILDQALPPYNPQKYLKYFHKAKVIIVDRDPRDIYVDLLKYPSYPTNKVRNFIRYFKSQRLAIERSKNTNQVIDVKFEDLIFNYDFQIENICSFLNMPTSLHSKKKQYFDPMQSANNVGLWKVMKDSDEIKLIEKELSKYLFHF